MAIIDQPRSIIPACDVDLEHFKKLVAETHDLPGIGGYKIGPGTGQIDVRTLIAHAREYTDKSLIYDGQKLATDTPDTAERILAPLKKSGVDAVILFPLSGPVTQFNWTQVAQDLDLDVIIGGHMTHERFLANDYGTESKGWIPYNGISGYIRQDAPRDIYTLAATMIVRDFVMPGTHPESVREYRKLVENLHVTPTIYAPGLGKQPNDIEELLLAAGPRAHPIIGGGIYDAQDMREAAQKFIELL